MELGNGKLERVISPVMYMKPEQRWLRHVEVLVALSLDILLDNALLLCGQTVPNVFCLDNKRSFAMHKLERLAKARKIERSAQDRVPLHYIVHRLLESRVLKGQTIVKTINVVVIGRACQTPGQFHVIE